ncbi:MAG: alpha/beta hydrolase [Leucobacter sp.]|nr:alpha/beta hydrolase [Leucobacter sp.]
MSVLYRAPDGTAFSTPEELDEQYDLVASLPQYSEHGDFDRYMEEWAARSEAARGRMRSELGIPYGATRAETLDVFPGEPGGPIVVFVHGGTWMALTSLEHSFVAEGLVANGATVVVPSYALCPDVTIDEIVRQTRAAVAWTYRNAAAYGADPARIAVIGHSAGGHLVGRLLETEWEKEYGLPSSVISGACAVSGMFDLRPIVFTADQSILRFSAEEVLRNSTILNLPLEAPHLLLTAGEKQPREYHRQSTDFLQAWQGVGLSGEYWERAGVNHFDELDDLVDPDSELTRRVLALADGTVATS